MPFDALPPGTEAQRAALHLTAFHGIFGDRLAQRYRWRGGPSSDYVGLFALEGETVLAQVFVLDLPYQFPRKEERVAGLAAITTRPDRARRGLARRLMRAVIDREARAGKRHILLWTNRSWGAHRLYEQLGFRDLHSPWFATKRIVRTGGPAGGGRVRVARRMDLPELERYHRRTGRDLLGFARRPAEFLQGEHRAGEQPLKELLVLRRDGILRGYARAVPNHGGIFCSELVASDETAFASLVGSAERRAVGSSCAFAGTFVSRHVAWFASRGYHVQPSDWHVLMGLEIGRRRTEAAMRRHFGSDGPEFRCLGFDRF